MINSVQDLRATTKETWFFTLGVDYNVLAILLMLHQEFYSFLSERGLGKQLLVRGGTWQALIDIRSSVFPFLWSQE
ncbi:hypothetical protein [Microcoleus sp. S13_C5]|uniref:hypothetical protein n=1 Tax=Microcoleus sp. S13_C5 TaxID=3055411 RepID=UPI002FD29233